MQVHGSPLCCGIAIICGFGNDPVHARRDQRVGNADQTIEDIERGLRDYANAGINGTLRAESGILLGAVGMLIAAVNIPQREALAPTFRALGWRKAGRANNLHIASGESDVFLYRKVLADAITVD